MRYAFYTVFIFVLFVYFSNPVHGQGISDESTIQVKCLDGSEFWRQGTVDVLQIGNDGAVFVNQKSHIISSVLHEANQSETVYLRLQIISPHPDSKFDQTKQIVFGKCESVALVDWFFTPIVPGKHQINLKEQDHGSGYSSNFIVKDLNNKSIRDYIPYPLKQFESGIFPEKTICQVPLQLIIRVDGQPACVTPTKMRVLWDSDWANKSTDIYTKYSTKKIIEKFQSQIISKEMAMQIAQDYISQNDLILDTNMTKPQFRITADLVYSILSKGYLGVLSVDPKTGLPTSIMPPWWDQYYRNPQWWSELQKEYLGLPHNRVEDGEFVWRVAYRECMDCIASYPEFFINATSGKIVHFRQENFSNDQ